MGLSIMAHNLVHVFLPFTGINAKPPISCPYPQLGFRGIKRFDELPVHSSFRKLSSMVSCRAVGSDVNEETDDMSDDLFKKHGKVVFRRNEKPSGAEVDDDAESLAFAVAMAKVANEIDAIRTKMADLAEEKFGKIPNGDLKPNSWTLLDFGDAVVHIFLPPQREFYNLEEFYGNATYIELPFEDEKLFHR